LILIPDDGTKNCWQIYLLWKSKTLLILSQSALPTNRIGRFGNVRQQYFFSEKCLSSRKRSGTKWTTRRVHLVGDSEIWRILWKLPIQTAEKNFMWRACHNLLLIKDNLLRRKIVKEPFYPICDRVADIVTSHIAWVWRCAYMYTSTFNDNNAF
jgi:hypothetical protein